MDPKEQYGRSVAASKDGFVYEGIGTTQAYLVAYWIATGEHRDILPASDAHAVEAGGGNMARVHERKDGKVCDLGRLGGGDT